MREHRRERQRERSQVRRKSLRGQRFQQNRRTCESVLGNLRSLRAGGGGCMMSLVGHLLEYDPHDIYDRGGVDVLWSLLRNASAELFVAVYGLLGGIAELSLVHRDAIFHAGFDIALESVLGLSLRGDMVRAFADFIAKAGEWPFDFNIYRKLSRFLLNANIPRDTALAILGNMTHEAYGPHIVTEICKSEFFAVTTVALTTHSVVAMTTDSAYTTLRILCNIITLCDFDCWDLCLSKDFLHILAHETRGSHRGFAFFIASVIARGTDHHRSELHRFPELFAAARLGVHQSCAPDAILFLTSIILNGHHKTPFIFDIPLLLAYASTNQHELPGLCAEVYCAISTIATQNDLKEPIRILIGQHQLYDGIREALLIQHEGLSANAQYLIRTLKL